MEDLLSEFRKNQDGKDRIEQKLGTIETKVNTNTKNFNDHLTKYKKEFNDLSTKCQSMKLVVDAAISDMQERKKKPFRERVYELEKVARDLNFRDEEARRQNSIMQRIPEATYLETKQAVTDLLSTLGIKVSSATVNNIQQVGKRPNGKHKPRPIKVKFLSSISKQDM